MDTDKPLLYRSTRSFRECTLIRLCIFRHSVGQHVFGISYYYDVHAS